MPTININPELQSLIPPLTPDEYAQLEQNILKDGCHDALVIWQEEQTLLDGHNGYEICERHGLPYNITELSLPDLDSAKTWMIMNQLGRRNLTPEQLSYFRGKQYELQKKRSRGGGDRKSAEAQYQKPHNEVIDNTAAHLAEEHKVSKVTIERDAAYSKAIDTIADVAGTEARQELLSRKVKITQQEVKKLAKIARTCPQHVKPVLEAASSAKTPKQARQIVREAARGIVTEERRLLTLAASEALADAGIVGAIQEQVSTAKLARLLQKALWSLDALHGHLVCFERGWLEIPLSEALDKHTKACILVGKTWHGVERLITQNPIVLHALYPPLPTSELSKRPGYGSLPAKVWAALQARKRGATAAELATAIDGPRGQVWAALQRMVRQGKATKHGTTYRIRKEER
jgi:hypothetical protein